MLIQRLIEIFMALPTPLFFCTITFIEPSIFHIMVVIGLFRWTGYRSTGEFYRPRNLDFVTAQSLLDSARAGLFFSTSCRTHWVPFLSPRLLVSPRISRKLAVVSGLGDINVPSWGQTLNAGYKTGEWYLIMIPGIAIFITVTLLNLVGEGLRDALDPKMRK